MTQEQFLHNLYQQTTFGLPWVCEDTYPICDDEQDVILSNYCGELTYKDISLTRTSITVNNLSFSLSSEKSKKLVKAIFDYVTKEENVYEMANSQL